MVDIKKCEVFGKDLVSVCEYTVGHKKKILIILDRISFNDLIKFKKGLKYIPLIMTEKELMGSRDVFPLEILTITKTYKMLCGKDLFKNLKIEKKHVRHQLEFEFRSKLIHLRQEFLAIKSRSEFVKMLKTATNVLAPIFHGLLYLKDSVDEYDNFFDYIDKLKKLYKVDFTVIEAIKAGNIKRQNVNKIIDSLMKFLYELSEIIERYIIK